MPPSRGKALVESLPKPPPSQRAARSSDPFEGAFFAPGAAGQQARQLVRKVCTPCAKPPRRTTPAHPSLCGAQYRDQGVTLQLVQERSGNYKPLYRAFPHKDGLSTVPTIMQGHPDDVRGGRLISSEVRHSLEPRSARPRAPAAGRGGGGGGGGGPHPSAAPPPLPRPPQVRDQPG